MKLIVARSILTLALLVAALVSSAAAAEQASSAAPKHLLRYQFAMGEELRYEVHHATKTRNMMEGVSQQVETQSDSVKSWKVTDVLPNGDMEFIHVVEWIKMTNTLADGSRNEYDSRRDARPPRGFDLAARAVGVPLSTVRIAPDGEVTFREELHPQPKSHEDLPITLQLPEHSVAVGEKWTYPYDVPVQRQSGANMQVQTRRVCRLRDVAAGIALIDVEYQILTPVDPYVRAQLVERLTEGTVRFDIARGRVIRQEHNVDKRILGYAGKASSMHFASRLQERLLPPDTTGPVRQASATSEK